MMRFFDEEDEPAAAKPHHWNGDVTVLDIPPAPKVTCASLMKAMRADGPKQPAATAAVLERRHGRCHRGQQLCPIQVGAERLLGLGQRGAAIRRRGQLGAVG